MLLAGLFERFGKNLERSYSGVFLIVGLDNVPGSVFRTGLLQHLIYRDLVLIPFLSVAPVFFGYLPLFLRSVLSGRKALELGIAVYLYPELLPVMTGSTEMLNGTTIWYLMIMRTPTL